MPTAPLAALPLALFAVACAPPPRAPAPPPPQNAQLYRLDFVIATNEGARSTYTLNVEDRSSGEVHVGANVPLGGNDARRLDVGVKIRCRVESRGDNVLLKSDAELSASAPSSTVQKISVRGDALAAPGKAALVASLDEPSTHTHYDVTVTATRL